MTYTISLLQDSDEESNVFRRCLERVDLTGLSVRSHQRHHSLEQGKHAVQVPYLQGQTNCESECTGRTLAGLTQYTQKHVHQKKSRSFKVNRTFGCFITLFQLFIRIFFGPPRTRKMAEIGFHGIGTGGSSSKDLTGPEGPSHCTTYGLYPPLYGL